jgi:NCAIR mutase (PurE)-related protein
MADTEQDVSRATNLYPKRKGVVNLLKAGTSPAHAPMLEEIAETWEEMAIQGRGGLHPVSLTPA